jgi:hypothetical protein
MLGINYPFVFGSSWWRTRVPPTDNTFMYFSVNYSRPHNHVPLYRGLCCWLERPGFRNQGRNPAKFGKIKCYEKEMLKFY